jgi:hypothetical protein
MIKVIKSVEDIDIIVYPGKKENFRQPIKFQIKFAGKFIFGDKNFITFYCTDCKNIIKLDFHFPSKLIIKSAELSVKYFNKVFLEEVREMFNLNWQNEYALKDEYKYNSYSRLGYFKCPTCEKKYFFVGSLQYGDDGDRKSPTSDYYNVSGIKQIDFNENILDL